jgi:hypothetical protein
VGEGGGESGRIEKRSRAARVQQFQFRQKAHPPIIPFHHFGFSRIVEKRKKTAEIFREKKSKKFFSKFLLKKTAEG